MPVVFLCQNCRSRLKITRRKIVAQIECPRCQAEIIVPTQEAANASLAMADAARQPPPEDIFAEFMVFDDPLPVPKTNDPPIAAASPPPPPAPPPVPPRPAASERTAVKGHEPPAEPGARKAAEKAREKRSARRGAALPATQPASADPPAPQPRAQSNGSAPPSTSSRATRSVPPPATAHGTSPMTKTAPSRSSRGAKLLISRRMVYFQAFLICLMALVGLAGGYLIGRAIGPVKPVTREKEPVFEIAGSVKYRNTRGELVPDFQAVAIALPADKNSAIPSDKLGTNARRDEGHQAEMAIHELGGAYARASGDGSFALRLPKPGRYNLLLISKETKRAADRKVTDSDLVQIRRYFTSPTELIGQSRYLWVEQEVREPRIVVFHAF